MGLDVGGSGARCLLVDVESGQVVTAVRGWEHRVVLGTALATGRSGMKPGRKYHVRQSE